MRCAEVCTRARHGCMKGFAEWGFLDAGEGLGLEFQDCSF
jgi:hypothetical protein